MLEETEYKKKLEETLLKINEYFDFSDIRGNGVGSFIFAKKTKKTVEIYQSENSVIIELWENEDSDSTEMEVGSYQEVVDLVTEWINKK